MLHENPLMLHIDVDHWRNLQSLLLESAKDKRRIVVIHEDGEILKFVHTRRAEIVRPVDRVDDPHAVAEQVYLANEDTVDFVAVFERRAFDRYMGQWQDTWRPDEDLDAFVQRTYATIDEYADGLVTYPGPARDTLGLQWRLGTTYAAVQEAVDRFVVPDSSVVFGIFERDALWATLVLRFDSDRRVDVVTTADMLEVTDTGNRETTAAEVVGWLERTYGTCSLALFTDLAGAKAFLADRDKAAALRRILTDGYLRAERVPEGLRSVLGGPHAVTAAFGQEAAPHSGGDADG